MLQPVLKIKGIGINSRRVTNGLGSVGIIGREKGKVIEVVCEAQWNNLAIIFSAYFFNWACQMS